MNLVAKKALHLWMGNCGNEAHLFLSPGQYERFAVGIFSTEEEADQDVLLQNNFRHVHPTYSRSILASRDAQVLATACPTAAPLLLLSLLPLLLTLQALTSWQALVHSQVPQETKGRLWARLGPDVCSPWSQWSMEAVAESWWGCFHGHRTQHKLLMLEWMWGLLLHSKQHQHWSESDLVLVFTWSGFDPVLICTWTTPDLVMFSTCSCLDPSSLWGIDQEPVACWYINHHGHDCVRRQSKGHRNLTSIYWVFLWGRCWLC